MNRNRRRLLKGGLGSAALFLPLPYVWVRAQSDGAVRLVRAPKVALVMGNGDYRSAPALRNAVNDARAIAGVLEDFGFDVTLKLDGSRSEMEAAIEAHTLRLAQGNRVGVFYYAGHGLQLSWTNYLVPVDARVRNAQDVQASCVDLAFLMGGVRKAANPMNVIVLDACRDNPFEGDFTVSNKGLTQMDAPNDTLLAYATAPGNVASDGDGANGLYTESLIKEIRTPETRVEDVFKRVRLNVRRKTGGAQVPWESTSLEEDFWFLPPGPLVKIAGERARAEAEALRAADAQRISEAQRVAAAEAQRKARAEARATRERDERESAESERKFKEELARWESIRESRNPEDFYAFLLERPSGYIAEQAQFRLDQLERPRVQAQPGPNGVTPLPSGTNRYALGDQFTYERTDHLKNEKSQYVDWVTYADDVRVEFNNGRLVLDQMGSILRNRRGTKNPGLMGVPADMAVGKRWRSAVTNTRADGLVGMTIWDFQVVALEDIRVPAGSFRAFKVTGNLETRYPTSATLGSQSFWVDPATMMVVRKDNRFYAFRERFGGGPRIPGGMSEDTSTQLVSFKLAPR